VQTVVLPFSEGTKKCGLGHPKTGGWDTNGTFLITG
jgi:hypothetical protein